MLSLTAAAAAFAVTIFVLVFGFRPHLEIQKQLSQTSIIEELKKNFGAFTPKADKEPPLVIQARAFALRIDPPPPPPVLKKIMPPLLDPIVELLPPVKPQDQNKGPAEFTLIGTASYTEHPEKSLALLSLVSGDYKWVRPGEMIDQSTVGEINDGTVVIYKDGARHKDLFVPRPQNSLKPLLKN